MNRLYEIFLIIGIICIVMGFGIAYGQNSTNSTNDMTFGDKWNCGYINATTTLESLRDCFRD